MKLQVQLPREEEIIRAAKLGGIAVAGIIVAKAVSAIVEKIHEKKQDRDIKKLKARLDEQEARIAKLEKAK